MDYFAQRYNLKPAAAWLRGHALTTGLPQIDAELLEMPLEVLTDEELAAIVSAGEQAGLKLYPFKSGKEELPRCAGQQHRNEQVRRHAKGCAAPVQPPR